MKKFTCNVLGTLKCPLFWVVLLGNASNWKIIVEMIKSYL